MRCLQVLASVLLCTITLLEAKHPNIILLLADDLGWADLACYGNDLHETPNLDRLARQGIRFTDAYAASPVCTPPRASILTGKHPARLHMTIWRESARERGRRQLLEPVCLDSLPLEHTTLAEILKEAGYFNAHIGKWHLGRAEAYPQPHGFHVNIGGTLWGAPQTFWYPYNGDAYFRDWRYVPDLEPGKTGDYLTDRLTDKGLEIMEKQSKAGRPFFLNLWYHTVHMPIEGKPQLVKYYYEKIQPDSHWKNPHYAAMVHSLDENVGRVLTKVKDLGISDNTLVVFTSDNGGFVNRCKLHRELQVANNFPLRSGKGSCYEGGIRIPLIIRGPGVIKGGKSSTPIYSCDLLPTLLHATGDIRSDRERSIIITGYIPHNGQYQGTFQPGVEEQVPDSLRKLIFGSHASTAWREAGSYRAQWKSVIAASGVFLIRLRAGDFVENRKAFFMK